jgi:hypothetical protein
MSDTPRTDAAAFHTSTNGGLLTASVVTVDVAIKLERELNAANAALAQRTAERDEARRELCHYKCRSIMDECPDAITAPQLIARNRGWDCFEEAKP